MQDIYEAIESRQQASLILEYEYEMLKLKLCVNLEVVYDIIANAPREISDRISQELKLTDREKEMLETVRLVDLDAKTIGRSLAVLREKFSK